MPDVVTNKFDIWSSALLDKSTAGRGTNGKVEAYGVKKLRELIFELAAKGLLVDKTPELPEKTVRIEEIADLVMGQAPQGNDCNKDGVGTVFVKTGEFGDLYPDVVEWTTNPLKFAKAGDVLICVVGATVGKLNLAIDCAIGRSVAAIRPKGNIETKYLYFALMPYTLKLRSQSRGSAQGVIGKAELNSVEIRLPSLEEQHRIVAKVDELMALCDQLEQKQTDSIKVHQTLVETLLGTLTSVESQAELSEAWSRIANHFGTLFITERSIDQLKETILQLAVMGKLAPQDPNDEPASVLLETIAQDKVGMIKAKEINEPKKLAEINVDEMPFKLPHGWQWAHVWDVAKIITSGSRDWAKYYSDSGAIFITMGNLSRGDYRLRMDSIRYVNPPLDGEGVRTRLEANDLLISITGDVGNLGLIPKDFEEAYINQHTCLLRFMPSCQNRYFSEVMRSPWAKYQFDAPQRGVKNSFRLSDVGEMLIPIPPLAEQHRIVAKVDQLIVLCDGLKARLNHAQTTQIYLADAIVEQVVA